MTELEYSFLCACHELVLRQGELIPLLAATLGVPPGEVLYSWMRREFPAVEIPPGEEWRLQIGRVRGTDWDSSSTALSVTCGAPPTTGISGSSGAHGGGWTSWTGTASSSS